MCLLVKTAKEYNKLSLKALTEKYKKVAEKDIIVYKVVRKTFSRTKEDYVLISQHRGFSYEVGFHYYQTGKKFTFQRCWAGFEVYQGLHSFSKKPNFVGYNQVILKCTIPKGSVYYKNTPWLGDVEYASDNLIVVEEIK